jgi:hypothetical protein
VYVRGGGGSLGGEAWHGLVNEFVIGEKRRDSLCRKPSRLYIF